MSFCISVCVCVCVCNRSHKTNRPHKQPLAGLLKLTVGFRRQRASVQHA